MGKFYGSVPAVATVLKVRKEGSKFYGDLHWSDGHVWTSWQIARTLKGLTQAARCTFPGEIVRV